MDKGIINITKEAEMKEGDKVRLKGRKRTATIIAMLDDIKGGVRLNKRLGGYQYWNIADLERVN
jgi:hypothetical protein